MAFLIHLCSFYLRKKQTVYQKYCIWQNNISEIKSKIKVLPNNQKLRELLLIDLSYKKKLKGAPKAEVKT